MIPRITFAKAFEYQPARFKKFLPLKSNQGIFRAGRSESAAVTQKWANKKPIGFDQSNS